MSERRGLRLLAHRLHLLASAWRLHGKAQGLAGDESLPATQELMLGQASLPVGANPADALWAAGWAGRLQRRLTGKLDTCLIRSLVAAALVADGPEVAVRIGVHRTVPGAELLDAHAWLTVDEREIHTAEPTGHRFEEVMVLPMERG